jgi:hypothetical protein
MNRSTDLATAMLPTLVDSETIAAMQALGRRVRDATGATARAAAATVINSAYSGRRETARALASRRISSITRSMTRTAVEVAHPTTTQRVNQCTVTSRSTDETPHPRTTLITTCVRGTGVRSRFGI